jgi:hypothetical protein
VRGAETPAQTQFILDGAGNTKIIQLSPPSPGFPHVNRLRGPSRVTLMAPRNDDCRAQFVPNKKRLL